jgi:allophanate hydrolase
VPAAYNNIVGLKPTRGLVSTTGVVPACRTLDCISVFAGNVGDADRLLRLMQGFDAGDPYSRRAPAILLSTDEFTFGVLDAKHREFHGDLEMAALYDAAILRMIGIGGTPVEVDFAPFFEAGALLYDGPFVAERLAALGAFMERHADHMDPTVRGIVARGAQHSAADGFAGEYHRVALKRETEHEWKRIEVLLLPTVPAHDRIADVLADPVGLNAKLGRYTNFVNLLDCCAIAVPGFFRENGLPFGVTLVAPAFSDASLAILADRFHRAGTAGAGMQSATLNEDSCLVATAPADETVPLFVVGAHLSGMPLNHELIALGGKRIRECRTAPDYRLYVLPNTVPPKPGMVRVPDFVGGGILGEVWTLSPAAFGSFVGKIPAPLGIGKIALDDGSSVSGFLCETHAVQTATEITAFGGWRAFIATNPFRKTG